jgi:hypothetical protein
VNPTVPTSLALVLALAACGDNDAASPGPDGGGTGHVYALSTLIWSDVATTGYVVLSDTLDRGDVSLATAYEFPGYASIAVADGQLLVTTADAPTIERFAITDTLEWQPSGRMSLHNQGVTDSGFYRQYMQRGHMAYAEIDAAQRALWDPIELAVVGTAVDTRLTPRRDGLDLFANYNRNYFSFEGPVVRSFSYHDQDWFRWAADSQLVVHDPDTHAEAAIVDAPCPGLDTITADESGNLYFSNWEYPALHALTGSGAAPCVVRLRADRTLDSSWQADLRSWAGDRHVVNLRYLRDGKAIGAVLHHEDFGAGFDFPAELADQESFWAAAPLHHRLWMFDLVAGTGQPVRGLAEQDIPPTFSHAELDGRIFLMREAADYSRTTVYELGLDGVATRRFEVPGSSYQWVKLR